MPEQAEIDNCSDSTAAGSITLPAWYIWAQGGFLTLIGLLFIPWAVWVTLNVFSSIAAAERINDISSRLSQIEKSQGEISSAVRVIEATRFTAADGRQMTAGLEQRFDRLEAKFDQMRRDVDRGIPASGDK